MSPQASLAGPRPAPRRGDDIHDSPWVTLAYLLFVFVPLAFMPPGVGRALLASLVAIGVIVSVILEILRRRLRNTPSSPTRGGFLGWRSSRS